MDVEEFYQEIWPERRIIAHERVPKRYIRDFQNPFEFHNGVEFKRRYRFTKDCVMHKILPLIANNLRPRNNRGLPITPPLQLLITLRFYATGSFQIVGGDLVGISQSSVCRIVTRISSLLAAQMLEWIKMPTSVEEQTENRRLFREIGARRRRGIGLPGIDGALDCTHIRLSNVRFNQIQENFRNRKGYFSLNVQALVGPRMEFLDIVPEWPGSEHDSRIFQNSRLHMRYRQGQLTGTLLGDAGYPCLPFLLTPLSNPTTQAEQDFNILHSITRGIVERGFGLWKRRFPCLSKGLGNKLVCCTSIIVACAVLHNMALKFDRALPEDENLVNDDVDEEILEAPQARVYEAGEGFAIRTALIDRLFG